MLIRSLIPHKRDFSALCEGNRQTGFQELWEAAGIAMPHSWTRKHGMVEELAQSNSMGYAETIKPRRKEAASAAEHVRLRGQADSTPGSQRQGDRWVSSVGFSRRTGALICNVCARHCRRWRPRTDPSMPVCHEW